MAAMTLAVRRVKVSDIPVLEGFESETVKRFPLRKRWMETYRGLLEEALSDEPEGVLVADFEGRAVGAAIARVRGLHAVTGAVEGRLEALTVAPGWRSHSVAERLIQEADAYFRSRGCQVMTMQLPVDAGADASVFKEKGFSVAGWELERPLG